jgi:hypothetical protein
MIKILIPSLYKLQDRDSEIKRERERGKKMMEGRALLTLN